MSLVGAGPGDPGLLTLRALKRLREADVVYHDALVPASILALRGPRARLVAVGRRRGSAARPQEAIAEALIRDARAGLAVVRLKGGDPFVFGRGGEEALALARAGVRFDVVPGISAGIAAPAASGIPLTYRGLSSAAAFVTAHDLSPGPAGDACRARIRALARGADTIVFFMAGAERARVRQTLLDAGLPPDTPAAVIESGTLPEERFAEGTLDRLTGLGGETPGGPVLIVVGRTVALAKPIRRAMSRRDRIEQAAVETAAVSRPRGARRVERRAG